MSNVNKTIGAIRAAGAGRYIFIPNLPNSEMLCKTDDLKALADAYEALQAECRELREALEQIANRSPEEMRLAKTLHYDMQGIAQAVLDKHKGDEQAYYKCIHQPNGSSYACHVCTTPTYEVRNDKAVIDEFLAAVRGHENKICRCLTVAECECFELAVIKVYAERFGNSL